MDDSVNDTMDVGVGGSRQDPNQATDPAASTLIEKKKQDRQDEDEKLWKPWNKRERHLSATVTLHSELAEKYKEWSAAQDLDLLGRPLLLASIEELNVFMCNEILRFSQLPEAIYRKPWFPSLLPLHPPYLSYFPFWAKDHPANHVVRRHHATVRIREEHIRLGTLPCQATDHHVYHTDMVVTGNRKRAGVLPIDETKDTTAYLVDDERAVPRRRKQEQEEGRLDHNTMSVCNGDKGRSTMQTRFVLKRSRDGRFPNEARWLGKSI
jgi:hypothetical protein